jgi:hypothetical protein
VQTSCLEPRHAHDHGRPSGHGSDPSVLCMSQVVESRGERPSARYAHVAMQYDQGTRMAILGGADGKGARLTDLYTVVSMWGLPCGYHTDACL